MERTILHVDMDAFFAAIEQHDHPEWRGRPVVVGAQPDARGVVAAASYEARRFGIHSAMPSRDAGRRCPEAIFTPVNMARYHDVSRQIFGIFERFTPDIEPLSLDEAFLDVSGAHRLFGPGPEIARRIKATIVAETGLTASIGVAPNKFLAKLASDLNKPDGLTLVPTTRAAIMAFLAPLPVGRIWGVGAVTGAMLNKHGIATIGDLQRIAEPALAAILGRHGAAHLRRLAMGEDARDVAPEREEKRISREHTFPRDCQDAAVIIRLLDDLVEDVARRLRADGRFASVAHLKLRWKDFKTITRQRPLAQPSCDDFTLRHAAQELLRAEPLKQPVRLIGFGVSHLVARSESQLSLFPDAPAAPERRERLSHTVDAIRRHHGTESIRRASAHDNAPPLNPQEKRR